MNTTDTNQDNDYNYLIIIITAIFSFIDLIINAHHSYKKRVYESDCCGNSCSFKSNKERFDP